MIAAIHDLLQLTAPDEEVVMVEASEVPQPQRRLLDHARDMTGTLEAFTGEPLTLKPLHIERQGGYLYRRVVLLAGDRPVEYGAIRIDLEALPAAVRPVVELGEQPLGGLLARAGVELTSVARGFLRTDATPAVEALGCSGPLFGRLARLCDAAGRTLADVVEILPELEDRA